MIETDQFNLSPELKKEFIELYEKAKKENKTEFEFHGQKILIRLAEHLLKHFIH